MADSQSPKIQPNSIIQIKGRECSTYDGKLNLAHQHDIQSLCVSVLQFPSPENSQTCICQAELHTSAGLTFVDIGDASPDNVPKGCSSNFIRIASTRAKSRVMSDAFNIPSHLTDMDEEGVINVSYSEYNLPQTQKNILSLPEIPKDKNANKAKMEGGGNKPMSDRQKSLIENLASSQGASGENMAQNLLHKALSTLTGAEANTLIRSLKNDSLY